MDGIGFGVRGQLHCKKYPSIHGYFVASFPVPYTFVSVKRRNNEARVGAAHSRPTLFITPPVYGYKRIDTEPVPLNKKHLKNVGPIRHSEPPHAAFHSPGVATVASHAACASMSTTTTTTTTTRDRGDRYGPMELAQLRTTRHNIYVDIRIFLQRANKGRLSSALDAQGCFAPLSQRQQTVDRRPQLAVNAINSHRRSRTPAKLR